jgi:hypothetical protein
MTSQLMTTSSSDVYDDPYYQYDEHHLFVVDTAWFWLVGVAGSALCAVGVVGNALSAVVWACRELRSASSSSFFLALSLYDLGFLAYFLAGVCTSELVCKVS